MATRRARLLLVAVLLLAAVAPLTLRAFHRPVPFQLVTASVTEGAVVRHITASGTLEAVTTVQVGAQVSGTIASLAADYNTIVRKGEVLAKLDPALFVAALDEAKASLEEAVAGERQARAALLGSNTAVDDARMKLTRAEQLAAKQLIAAADLDAARIAYAAAHADAQSATSQLAVAHAAVAQAQAVVDQASANLDRTVITSPIDGIVVARNVDVGQTVAAAVQAPVLFNVAADLTHMQLEVDIDESDIAGIEAGELVTFEVESYPQDTFTGTVSSVRLQPVVDQSATATTAGTSAPTSTTVPAVISYATMVDVVNADEKLRPGMTATVSMTGARRGRVVRVPNAALSFQPSPDLLESRGEPPPSPLPNASDPSWRRVWRIDGAHLKPVDVRVGLADAAWTELVAGSITPGDALVTTVLRR